MEIDFTARYAVASEPGIAFVPIAYLTDDETGAEDRRFVWMHAAGDDRADVFPVDALTERTP
jgi:hypothetical protein